MRKSCYDCVRKHLGSAGIFIKETKMGYPNYDIWAIGELEHAADECLEENPDLALIIREHRLRWMEDHSHRIPIEELNSYIKACASAEENLKIPRDVLGELVNEDGDLSLSNDTRP